MHEEVSRLYGMDIPTYRDRDRPQLCLILSDSTMKKEILVGRIFQSKQMKLGL